MKKLLLVSVLMVFTGCATSSVQTGPAYMDWETGKKKFDAKVVLADTSFFAPSTADTLMMECIPDLSIVAIDPNTGDRRVVENNLEDEELLATSRCRVQNAIAHDTTTGAGASFVAPVVRSAAIAYGAHQIGKGIGRSGDRTSVNNNSSNKNAAKGGKATGGKATGGKSNSVSSAKGGQGGQGGKSNSVASAKGGQGGKGYGGDANSNARGGSAHAHADSVADAHAHADSEADASAKGYGGDAHAHQHR